jgi:membrane-bound serine protease (ClpP class)
MRRKVMNDTIAYAKTIAEQRGRNKDWVVKAVTEAASITEQEALRNKVIDIVASSPQELLVAINGRTVKVAGGKTLTLRTKDAPFQEIPKNWRESLLMFLAHPNVFYILMLLAIYGILGELQNPGATFPGVIGAIALLLALYAASVLPVNALGVALILLAFVLFVAELFTTSHGVLTAGALVSFTIGSIILFQSDSPVFRVSFWLIGSMTALTGAAFLFVAYSGIRAQFRRKVSGQERLIGMIGRARTKLEPEGMVFVDGTLWRAIALDPPIEAGEYVQVDRVDGLTLYVRWQPKPAPTAEERESARASERGLGLPAHIERQPVHAVYLHILARFNRRVERNRPPQRAVHEHHPFRLQLRAGAPDHPDQPLLTAHLATELRPNARIRHKQERRTR